jgi:hypothetical protein
LPRGCALDAEAGDHAVYSVASRHLGVSRAWGSHKGHPT